jgi:hypothetical protein
MNRVLIRQDLPGCEIPHTDFRTALRAIALDRWPHSTTGHMAKAWDISKTQAENLLKGSGSDRLISHIVRAGGPTLGLQLLAAVLGERWREFLNSEPGRAADDVARLEAERRELVEVARRLRLGGSLGRGDRS